MPVSFALDMNALSARYRELQKALHPDKFASGSDHERRVSVQQAAHVNAAYHALKDPLNRANYMLTLAGVIAANQHVTIRDLEFLEQQMELREALAEIRHASDPMTTLAQFADQLDSMGRDYLQQLAVDFESADEQALNHAAEVSAKFQFVRKLQQDVQMLEEELM